MGRYIIKRLFWMIPIILGVTIVVFTLMTLCPGDPAEIILGGSATEADLQATREALGLNQPFLVRFGNYLYDTFVRFDFGKSWSTGASIKAEMMERLPRTMTLSLMTLTISVVIGITLGIIAAVNQNRWQDRVCMTLALVGVSIPNFWLSLLLILFFSVQLKLLPAMGIGTWKHFILPAMAGSVGNIATLGRQTRSSMLDVIRSDYITTARSKGVPEFKVITRHALKNALIPIITVIGTYFGRMLGGAMIIETIFAIPGMGTFIVGGVGSRDYPVVQTGSIFLAIVFSLCMLLVDLIYAAVDPRIKAMYERTKGK